MPLLGSSLAISVRDVYAGREPDGWEFTATLRTDVDQFVIDTAREALVPWLEPTPIDFAIAMLGELAVLTKRREGDDATDELTLRVYAERIAAYPRDAVDNVLRNWGGVFWPAWAELQAHLDRRVRARRVFAKALGL